MQRSSSLDFFRQLRLHLFFQAAQIDLVILHMHPSVETLAHIAHPLTGIDRQVRDQLKNWQRRQGDFSWRVLGQRPRTETIIEKTKFLRILRDAIVI